MTSPLFSTAYLPPVAYIAMMTQYDHVLIEQMETFPKQTFRNRAVIATAGGPLMLNVPIVRTNGNHTRTEEIIISYQEPWNIRHWRAIVSAYSAAPYFLYYRDGIEQILLQPYTRLIDLNDALLKYILKKLKINCTTAFTEDFSEPTQATHDHRYSLTTKHASTLFQESLLPHPYPQVFDTRYPFQPNLSIIDLLFNVGPESKTLLTNIATHIVG